jgi:hypothetical protein
MRAWALLTLLLALGAAFPGCGESGIGSPCFAGPQGTGNLRVLTGSGECSTSICVAYLQPAGYCSIECENNGSCPGGFICCPVAQTGPQNPCQTAADCTSRQTCRQQVCRPRQYCVRPTDGAVTCH